MKTDYKFWYITRNDNGFIIECAIRFYEGDITTEDEYNPLTQQLEPVTRYRRTKTLTSTELSHLGVGFVKDLNGKDSKVYTPKDFGSIKTDNELRLFLNNQINKDPIRTVVDDQSELVDVEKVK